MKYMKYTKYIVILFIILCIISYIPYNTPKSYTLETFWSPDDNHTRGQQVMTDMFRKFNGICRKHNIKYWCIGGTLIGTLRHKGWIPFDADMDICMLEEDYAKLQSVIQDELKDTRYMFQDKSVDTNYTSNIGKIRFLDAIYLNYKDNKVSHHGLQIDIFVVTNKNGIIKGTIEDKFSSIEYDMIFPLKELKFEDIDVYVPNQYKEYSKKAWGEYPPPMLPKEQQNPHEGPITFIIPDWIKTMYPKYY